MKLTLEEANRLMAENEGWLDLNGTGITELPEGLSVDGSLYLRGTRITELPDGLSIGGSLDLRDTPVTSLPRGLSVDGPLYLDRTPITLLPKDLAVGSSLYLNNTPVTTLPKGLAIGGSLSLDGTGITSLPEDLAVGDQLYMDGEDVTERVPRRLRNGDYVPGRYIYADWTLTHVKCEKHLDGYAVYVGKIKGKNVVSDGKHYAHCNKIRDGIADLLFKAAADRGAGQYKDLSLDRELPLDEAKAMYRVITGACRQGTEDFVAGLGDGRKDRYTVREMLELTEGRYGHDEFAAFFGQ